MSSSAKEEIVSTFLRLLMEKPLDKLTVTDVVTAGGITRQSFYYHFQDIPDLITHIVRAYADDLGSRAVQASTTREIIEIIFSPIWDCPQVVCRLMGSKKYQTDQILYTEVYGHFVRLFRLRRMEIGMGHRGMEVAANYYTYAVIGLVGTYSRLERVDRDTFIEQICRLARGDMFQNLPPT